MNTNELPCLGIFKRHSFDSWYWDKNRNLYCRECSLRGCSFFETAKTLIPVGQTAIVEKPVSCCHNWSPWQSTANQLGSYLPPWRYKRKCYVCNIEQKTEDLEKIL